jgi:hypothetical protein
LLIFFLQLIAHDRVPDARTVLWRLQKNAHSITEDHAVINAEMHEIEHALEEERAAAGGTTFLALFKSGPQRFRRRVLLGIGGQFMQQLSGINLITYVSRSRDKKQTFYLPSNLHCHSMHPSSSKSQSASLIPHLCSSLGSTA